MNRKPADIIEVKSQVEERLGISDSEKLAWASNNMVQVRELLSRPGVYEIRVVARGGKPEILYTYDPGDGPIELPPLTGLWT